MLGCMCIVDVDEAEVDSNDDDEPPQDHQDLGKQRFSPYRSQRTSKELAVCRF